MGRIGAAIVCFALLVHSFGVCDKKYNKYSAEANKPRTTPASDGADSDIKNLHRPFRMAKLNLVWAKAQHRLTEPKLKSLYTELRIHDKEEIAWKQLKDKDKEGLKEAELRQKLIGIMSSYDLLEHFDDTQDPAKVKEYRKYIDPHTAKSIFKDKRLNKLWEKAEVSGFTPEELKLLKQEFEHHQDRVDMYYSLLDNLGEPVKDGKNENAVDDEEHPSFNEITKDEPENNNIPNEISKDYAENINQLRDHHRDIQRSYEKLELLTANGPSSKDFIEPKVQDLWKLALSNNFSDEDLLSLRHELNHYEARLIKLRNLRVQHALQLEKHKKKKHTDKGNMFEEMEDRIKKQARKAEKLYDDIEKKISKHTEL